jgi:hypothetical protein
LPSHAAAVTPPSKQAIASDTHILLATVAIAAVIDGQLTTPSMP